MFRVAQPEDLEQCSQAGAIDLYPTLFAMPIALWTSPVAERTERFDAARELAGWLREHRTSSVLVDDAALRVTLAFAGSARNLVLPGTPEYGLQTFMRTPLTDYAITAAPRSGER